MPLVRLRASVLTLACVIVASCDEREPLPVGLSAPYETPLAQVGSGSSQYGVVVVNLNGVNDGTRRRLVGVAKNAGVKWARLVFYWNEMQTAPGTWNPAARDEMHATIDALVDSGIAPFVTLQNTAPWACWNQSKCDSLPAHAPDDYFAWQDWVQDAVEEFDVVTHWGIWNEPSSNFMLLDSGEDRVWTYRDLVIWAADPIRDAGDYVVAPEDGDTTFLQQIVSWPYIQYIDVISVHSYWPSFGNERLVAKVDTFARQALVPNGLPIWLSETGLNANEKAVGGYPMDQKQATHTTRVLQRMNDGRISNWKTTFVFHLHSPPYLAPTDTIQHRLVHYPFSTNPIPRLAFDCFKRVATGMIIPNDCTFMSECDPLGHVEANGNHMNGCHVATIAGQETPKANVSCIYQASISQGHGPSYSYLWRKNGQQVGTGSSVYLFVGNTESTLTLSVTDGPFSYGDTLVIKPDAGQPGC